MRWRIGGFLGLLALTGCSSDEAADKTALCAPWDAKVKEVGLPSFTEVRYGCTAERFQALSASSKKDFHAALVKAGYELRVHRKLAVTKARESVVAFSPSGDALYVTVRPYGTQGFEVSMTKSNSQKDETVPVADVEKLTEASFLELKQAIKKRQDQARTLLTQKERVPSSCKPRATDRIDETMPLIKVPRKARKSVVDPSIFGLEVAEVAKRRAALEAQTLGTRYAAYLQPKIETKHSMPDVIESYVGDVVVGIVDGASGQLLCRASLDPFKGKPEGAKRTLGDIERTAKLARDQLLKKL